MNFLALGGSLFVPATHKDLLCIISGEKYKNLKSVVIDIEDSIASKDLQKALKNLYDALENFKKNDLFVFIRPRNSSMLQELLLKKNIQNIDGFILPKLGIDNFEKYFSLLEEKEYFIMPSIEGKELFHLSDLQILRDKLLSFKEKIPIVRFGLEDMFRQVRMRRDSDKSVFDYAISNAVLGNFLALFKSVGFEVSGGVYPYFQDNEGFKKDLQRDLKEGLFSKTIIHPSQIDLCNQVYRVSQREYDEAKKILSLEDGIGKHNDQMLEATTMSPYAKIIVSRAKIYGIY